MRITTLVHGDDYVSAGAPQALEWFHMELQKECEIKSEFLGEVDKGGRWVQEGKALNRIIRWTLGLGVKDCIEWQADPRHVEVLIAQMRLNEGSNSVVAPCLKPKESFLDGPHLEAHEVTRFDHPVCDWFT